MLSGSSEVNQSLAWEVNVCSSIRFMWMCLEHQIGPFFFPSTGATYGPDLSSPVGLDTPQWPENIYGATKVAVERMAVYLKLNRVLISTACVFPWFCYPSHAPAQ